MNEIGSRRRATVHDVARAAGVSLATVDRVLNNRPGVRPVTAQKVEAAMAAIGFQRDLSASLLARGRDLRVVFLLPAGSNEFMGSLAGAVERRAQSSAGERLALELRRLRPLDPEGLARALDGLEPAICDCAVIVGSETPSVLAAVERASRRGVAVVTLVSDLPNSARRHFIGIDNPAAGRTAASLMGRFCPKGAIGVIAGSLALRDHRDRLDGFGAVLAREFPGLQLLGPLESHDEPAQAEALASRLLADHPDLAGIYNLGAGNAGLVAALAASERARAVRVIAHELTPATRAGLDSGAIDVVLDQNPDHEIREALRAAQQCALGSAAPVTTDPIEIGIFLRDNLR